ncbi:MAG: hypothetical protein ABEJ82_04200 [Haloplanus sp.]
MERCTNCGGQVSKDFVRVFGVDDGGVDGCPACFPRTDVVSDRVFFGPEW